jgi:hypothetical protein
VTTLAEVLEAQERPAVGGKTSFWHQAPGDGLSVIVGLRRENQTTFQVTVSRWIVGVGVGWRFSRQRSVMVQFETWSRGWEAAKADAKEMADLLPEVWPPPRPLPVGIYE